MQLSVDNVCVNYGRNKILNNVSFSLGNNQILGVIGQNGSGKSTILKTIVSITKPNSGEIYIDGNKVDRKLASKFIGYCPQENSFFGKLTARENIEYFGTLYGIEKEYLDIMINKMATLLGLSKNIDRLASNLSGGFKRRLNIACGITHQPSLIVLDEPSLGLDPRSRKNLWDMILKIRSTGTSIIVASNILSEIRYLSNRVLVVKNGTVAADINKREVSWKNLLREVYW